MPKELHEQLNEQFCRIFDDLRILSIQIQALVVTMPLENTIRWAKEYRNICAIEKMNPATGESLASIEDKKKQVQEFVEQFKGAINANDPKSAGEEKEESSPEANTKNG